MATRGPVMARGGIEYVPEPGLPEQQSHFWLQLLEGQLLEGERLISGARPLGLWSQSSSQSAMGFMDHG